MLASLYPKGSHVAFIPTPRRVIRQALLLSRLKEGERFADLGCGDGRVLLEASALGATATGVEDIPSLAQKARITIGPSVKIMCSDLFEAPLGDFDVVYSYLHKWYMDRLQAKLREESFRGRLVSYHFPLPRMVPKQKLGVRHQGGPSYLYLYDFTG